MTKRIPIKAAKEFAAQHGLTHLIIMAHSDDGTERGIDHVVTYGRTVEQCSQAADFGNRLKEALGWPESLQQQPSRVRVLQARIKELELRVAKLETGEEAVDLDLACRHLAQDSVKQGLG